MAIPSARFFVHTATFDAVSYPQDAAGGEVPTATPTAISVPCCVQKTGPSTPTEGPQGRRGSVAPVAIFFRPDTPPGRAAILALKVNDRVAVAGFPYPFVLDGPPFDESGRGAVFEASARDVR